MTKPVLAGLEPAAVFRWFETICAIPHGSGNTRAISDFCVSFARERGLACRQDTADNVVIWKPASPGYEDHPPAILQGHLDMVAEKEPDCGADLRKDGLRLRVEGDEIYAEGTTLGGDDGVAVAYALAILDDNSLRHPPLEIVLTADEEIGLLGAAALDVSDLRGRRLLNIDSEEEGVLTAGCAGGVRCTLALPVRQEPAAGRLYRLEVSGLTGGHSGVMIHKGRANANKVLAESLRLLNEAAPLRLAEMNGGSKDNAIPRAARAVFAADETAEGRLLAVTNAFADELRERYAATDPELRLTLCAAGAAEAAWDRDGSAAALRLLCDLPDGVQTMSRHIDGLVETSLNLGIVRTDGGTLELTTAVRSSEERDKAYLAAVLRSLAETAGASFSQQGDYPGWAYREDSPLRDTVVRVFEAQYGHPPSVVAIHAGLECGILAGKLPGLDAVSLGPNLTDIHTTAERMSISSVARVWRCLLGVLEQL